MISKLLKWLPIIVLIRVEKTSDNDFVVTLFDIRSR